MKNKLFQSVTFDQCSNSVLLATEYNAKENVTSVFESVLFTNAVINEVGTLPFTKDTVLIMGLIAAEYNLKMYKQRDFDIIKKIYYNSIKFN